MNMFSSFTTKSALNKTYKLMLLSYISFTSTLYSAFSYSAVVDEQDKESLAKELSNPVAALISMPLQLNYDENIGIDDKGSRTTLNIHDERSH